MTIVPPPKCITVTSALHTIANNIPAMVAPNARVTVALHIDFDTFDAIVAEHGGGVMTLGGTPSHPGVFRTTTFEINGVRANAYTSENDRGSVDVDVQA